MSMGPENPEVPVKVLPRAVRVVGKITNAYFERPLHYIGFGGFGIILVLLAAGFSVHPFAYLIAGASVAGAYLERYLISRQ